MTPEFFIQKAAINKHKVFGADGKFPLNLNIVGWRLKSKKVDTFNDTLSVYWKINNLWEHKTWFITTLPGIPSLFNPINSDGTAVLVPGQYQNTYALGTYKGYTALKQVKPVRVYRDNNRDGIVDTNPTAIQEGMFGIHIHRAGVWSKIVGMSSAGCQVFQKRKDFGEFIDLCSRAANFWGNSFTYTLMEI